MQLVIAAGCVAVPISVFWSRRRVFEPWAKVASIVICCFGLGWTALAFSLLRGHDAMSTATEVLLTRARILLGGVCLGLILGVLLARPYRKTTDEKAHGTV